MCADDFRLLVDLLRHEMAMVALVDQKADAVVLMTARSTRGPFASRISTLVTGHDGPVAVFQVADGVGEGRQRDRIGAEIHLAFAVADRERRALPRADQEIVFACEQEGQSESAAQPRQRRLHRVDRRPAPLLHLLADQMGDDLGVGLGT